MHVSSPVTCDSGSPASGRQGVELGRIAPELRAELRACDSNSKFISSDFKMSVFESGSTYACALASVQTSCSSAGETARWRIFGVVLHLEALALVVLVLTLLEDVDRAAVGAAHEALGVRHDRVDRLAVGGRRRERRLQLARLEQERSPESVATTTPSSPRVAEVGLGLALPHRAGQRRASGR